MEKKYNEKPEMTFVKCYIIELHNYLTYIIPNTQVVLYRIIYFKILSIKNHTIDQNFQLLKINFIFPKTIDILHENCDNLFKIYRQLYNIYNQYFFVRF